MQYTVWSILYVTVCSMQYITEYNPNKIRIYSTRTKKHFLSHLTTSYQPLMLCDPHNLDSVVLTSPRPLWRSDFSLTSWLLSSSAHHSSFISSLPFSSLHWTCPLSSVPFTSLPPFSSSILFYSLPFRDDIEPLCSLSDAIHVRMSRTCHDSTVIEGSRYYPVVSSLEQFWKGASALRFYLYLTSTSPLPLYLTSTSPLLLHSPPHHLSFIYALYLSTSLPLCFFTYLPSCVPASIRKKRVIHNLTFIVNDAFFYSFSPPI